MGESVSSGIQLYRLTLSNRLNSQFLCDNIIKKMNQKGTIMTNNEQKLINLIRSASDTQAAIVEALTVVLCYAKQAQQQTVPFLGLLQEFAEKLQATEPLLQSALVAAE